MAAVREADNGDTCSAASWLKGFLMAHKVCVIADIDQKLAVKAGKSRYGETILPIDVAGICECHRDALVTLPTIKTSRHGDAYDIDIDFRKLHQTFDALDIDADERIGLFTPLVELTPETVVRRLGEIARLNDLIAKKTEEREARLSAERVAKAKAWIALPAEERLSLTPCWSSDDLDEIMACDAPQLYPQDGDAALKAAIQTAQEEGEREAEKRNEKLREAAREAADEAERIRLAPSRELDAFVAEHGTPLQAERRAAGLMKDIEALALAADHVFRPLAEFTVVDESLCGVKSAPSKDATDQQFEKYKRIREAACGIDPDAVVQLIDSAAARGSNEKISVVTVGWKSRKLRRVYAV